MKQEQLKDPITVGYLKKIFKEQNVPDDSLITLVSPKEQTTEHAAIVMVCEDKKTKKPEVIFMPSLKGLI